jgi:histone deacetylase complex regulatory component SIN3
MQDVELQSVDKAEPQKDGTSGGDALDYLDQIKVAFEDRPSTAPPSCADFLAIMNSYKEEQIDTMQAITRVADLF